MIKHVLLISLILFAYSPSSAQIAAATHIAILKAEDALRYDKTLEELLSSPNEQVRVRAALAAGRIGNDAAIPALEKVLEENMKSPQALAMAAFAIGEIESIKGVRLISDILKSESGYAQRAGPLLARAVEAAGKIAAANANDSRSKEIGALIVRVLEDEMTPRAVSPKAEVIRLGLTAVLRARPAGAEETIRKFLSFTDPNIVADALNTLARLRAKNANSDARDLLATHVNAIVRANAARVLGAAEDKDAVDVLIRAATTDTDSRVRVASIRSLAALRDAKAAGSLVAHGERLLAAYTKSFKPGYLPSEHSEILEVLTTLGRILTNTENPRVDKMLGNFGKIDKFRSPEIYLAQIRIWPGRPGGSDQKEKLEESWRQISTTAQVLGEFATLEPASELGKRRKAEAPELARTLAKAYSAADPVADASIIKAGPDVLQAYARFKTPELAEILRTALLSKDVQIRATAANLLADLPASKENIDALNAAFEYARVNDIDSNDAILSTLDALIKLAPKGEGWAETMGRSIISPDHLVRQKVRGVLPAEIKKITSDQLLYEVTPYFGKGTKMGQVLNTETDYRRAATRKNGTVKAVFTTPKGTFTIDLLPEDAPLTVDNFVKLARAKYFDGLEVHRVVPNFVMQDGDPRGDGNGGPGWSVRCEVNMVPYERGAVGMALSGKDTGGSQWFVTHSPQPHLDGGYTVFGKVNETGMKVVDNIVRGDKLLTVRIIDSNSPQKAQRTQK